MNDHSANKKHGGSDTPAIGADGKGATRKLARHAATLQFENLPNQLVALIKQCVLDTLGVIVGASTLAPEAALVADYVKDLGGKPESTLLGLGGKAPAAWATFVNGSLGHMLDYDDVGEGGHVSVATVPVAFALAEKLGKVSGRDFIAAIAAGTDIHTRLAQAIDVPDWTMTEGWFATQLLGYISGAATAGRLMGLDEEQMENALGIAFNQLSGSRQMAVGAATHMRSMQAGFSGQGAVLSAQLASRGIIGDKAVIEGRYGLFKTYVRTETPDWHAIVDELGTNFPLLKTHGFKIWPACGYTRPTNAATLQLRQEHGLRPGDIESITIIGGTGGTRLLCEPLALKRRPKTSIDGKYSIPFTTAVMMAKGNVTLRDYTAEGLSDPETMAMVDKVTYREPTSKEKAGADRTPWSGIGEVAVEIRTKDGRVLTRKPESVPGDPQNPVSTELLEAKFRDCVSFSAIAVSSTTCGKVISLVRDLEHVADMAEIVRALA